MNAIRWSEKQCLLYLFPLIISISFAMDVFVPAMGVMREYFHTSGRVMQASLYLFMLTVALGQLLVGPLADRFGRRLITLVSAFMFLGGSLLAVFASTITLLLIARIIQAGGACGTYLLCFIIVRDNFSTHACARLFSILCGTNAMIASSAPVIGGLLLDYTGSWQSGFYFLTLLGVLMSAVALRNIPDYDFPKPQAFRPGAFRDILQQPDFFRFALIASVSLLGLYLFCALSPDILISTLHLSPTQYGLWFGLNALTVFASNLLAVRLTYSLPLEKIVRTGLFLMIAACMVMMGLSLLKPNVARFMLPMLSLTTGIGLTMGSATALALKHFQHQAGTATALVGACQFGLAGFIGILTAQWQATPMVLALPVLCLSVLALSLVREEKLHVVLD